MAGRNGVDQATADSVLQDSLGLSADDVGMNAGDDAFNNDDLGDDLSDDLGDDLSDDRHNDNDDGDIQPQPRQEQRQPQPRQEQQPKTPATEPGKIPPVAEVRADGRGNLVDKKTGQIVARAGAEARMYQKLHRTNQAYGQLQAQHDDITGRLQKAVEIGTQLFDRVKELQAQRGETSPEKYGLSSSEAIEALNFAKEAKTDPVGTIKKLLTRAAAGGIDLSSIGLSGGNFDPKAFMDLIGQRIDTAMNPLKERSQRETAQQQQEREATERAEDAKRTLNAFLAENPDAREYLPVFHQVYSNPKFQGMSLGEVWSRLQLNLMRRAAQQPSQQRPSNRQQSRNPRVPSSRRSPVGGGHKNEELAPVSMSYDDIVRGLL